MRHFRTRFKDFKSIKEISNNFENAFTFHNRAVYRQTERSRLNRYFSKHGINIRELTSLNTFNYNQLNDITYDRSLHDLSFIMYGTNYVDSSNLKIPCARIVPWYSTFTEDKRMTECSYLF